MKIIIEVSGGVVSNIISTENVEIYLIDHDDLKERGTDDTSAKIPMQPDLITKETFSISAIDDAVFGVHTPKFDKELDNILSEYE